MNYMTYTSSSLSGTFVIGQDGNLMIDLCRKHLYLFTLSPLFVDRYLARLDFDHSIRIVLTYHSPCDFM